MERAAAYAAVVLAGGAGRRLGGAGKPALTVAGRPMLHRVLAAVADAAPRVVVGPPELPVPAGVLRTRERPPGGGPAAATAAGLAMVPPGATYVALLAADLPLLTPAAVRELYDAATGPDPHGPDPHTAYPDGAVFVDGDGRPQWLCGVWRTAALRSRLAAPPGDLAGVALRALLGDLRVRGIGSGDRPAGGRPPPWWDCDTGADLRRAERWL